jgi:hypothetical protein
MSAGYTGTAEPAEPLNEGGEVEGLLSGEPLKKAAESVQNNVVDAVKPSTGDLSWTMKFFVLALIVAACFVYVKMHSPRRTGPSGRHGAYEKGMLP